MLMPISSGSFGKVKYATHTLLSCPVAIKIVDKIHAPAVIREIESWFDGNLLFLNICHRRHLHHPHIAQLYEVILSETKIHMVTEYVSGGELFDYVTNTGPLPRNQAQILFAQLVDAIRYCHENGIVHRYDMSETRSN